MKPDPQCRSDIRNQRQQRTDGGEPINSETRTVQQNGQSLYINPTDFGAITHGISCGDEVRVETYASGIRIVPVDDE